MLDIFLKSVGLLMNLITAGRKELDSKIKREFGEALVRAYFYLLEVISTSKKIIDILESSTKNRSLFLMPAYLRAQANNLLRWDNALRKIPRSIKLIAPDIKYEQDNLYGLKFSAVYEIARICLKNNVPLDAVVKVEKEGYYERLKLIAEAIEVPKGILDEIDDKTLNQIIEYLNSNKPNEKIKGLEKLADEIREFLLSNYKLEELLLQCKHFDKDDSEWIL